MPVTVLNRVLAGTRPLMSGNEAVARAVWESGAALASAYPGTPSTEILESLALYPDIVAQWGVNEKVALETAIGASLTGARAFCAMKHVGLNVAADALMSQALAGIHGGLVIAVADDVGLSSSQNEQDSRYWGRFAHLPVLEPADAQEAYAFTLAAFALSERFHTLVILRLTTRVCHVKALVATGERQPHASLGFARDPKRWVMLPAHVRGMIPVQIARDAALAAHAEESPLLCELEGDDPSIGIIASGPAALSAREAFPEAPLLKLGLGYPLPIERIRAFAAGVGRLLVVEETEPLVETELRAQGIAVTGKDLLPRYGELSVAVLRGARARLRGEAAPAVAAPIDVFPRPPTMCPGCPHLAPFYCLSRLRGSLLISGDIGCYTLGAGQPWQAMDACTCMGASLTLANGMAVAKTGDDAEKAVVAVIGDSTFLHMGMQGLLNLVYNRANVTVLLLDNRTVGMTGGQEHPGTGFDIHGDPAPRVDFVALVQALGVKAERVHSVDPYDLPGLFKLIRSETAVNDVSVILTNRPCVLTDRHHSRPALGVVEAECTGCGGCLQVGCPAIQVVRRDRVMTPSGREKERAFVTIDSAFCTGCNACVGLCAPKCIQPLAAMSERCEGV
ncbi:thiamine pyrophosphate-dependent enzyme [Rhodospirillum rubrum]|uniref:Indolepyruvate oxidoreductase subunit IorA n=1 Tax=Rhodospirillum rubrum (strain ATCC 11170 / ATH 1.1.1 / DSM 467 / LMG 4362 / NCIMB 8255 / S1) TaxID=269796 RepID=Q2RSW7_RHORT|nr:thiamine pyrophosphate-dependent enzyme [Rhodospirillum rubrum]ABC22778.1 indolepyruvate ferredoxin oxidoreductase [Rhodospirillum rubrum ATCC 11170]AEO48499.1 indolepyruvate ferredoxin oxidoreductase, alpha subunit [Rhodospirillum rubrum F11]MBK5954375.1 indolepyruvate ferredoxin oxidoreductase [Rhodospirillum rubrum]QXG78767.1 indolepyruvate ferredoxin oxidoreductase [Rhodospirillum rubrum]HAQ01499.1 indolepyruvate ferredoxin oxidoreductase [Rhodospirillum rubrum]